MADDFDISEFLTEKGPDNQYQMQLGRIRQEGNETECVEVAVEGALENLDGGDAQKSFVIYGEPQSGKTEMMICLTAKLLDEGYRFIIHLLNDSVDLLGQNMKRFHASGLAPSARTFAEILDRAVDVRAFAGARWLVVGWAPAFAGARMACDALGSSLRGHSVERVRSPEP